MEIKGLNLDDSPIIAEDKSLAYARNIRVENQQTSYMNEESLKYIYTLYDNICGIITTNNGFVVFYKHLDVYDHISYYEYEDSELKLRKTINGNFNFSVDRPITGDHSYNQLKQLLITFTEGTSAEANETRVININNPTYNDSSINDDNVWGIPNITLTDNDLSLINLIVDTVYPTLKFNVISGGGNLKTGAYQLAFRYKLNDNSYTNWSILHEPVIITGDMKDDFPVGYNINKSIQVSFTNGDTKFKEYEYGVVYMDGEGQLAYRTEPITLNSSNSTYTIGSFESMSSLSLEEIMVKNITYIKDATHTNFNNRLLRGNVETVDYSGLDNILTNVANRANVGIDWTPKEDIVNTTKRYHKEGEVYSLYMGFLDYKGNFVNAYKIPYYTSGLNPVRQTQLGSGNNHLIPAGGTGKAISDINNNPISRFIRSSGNVHTIYYTALPINSGSIDSLNFHMKTTDYDIKQMVDSNEQNLGKAGIFTTSNIKNSIPIRTKLNFTFSDTTSRTIRIQVVTYSPVSGGLFVANTISGSLVTEVINTRNYSKDYNFDIKLYGSTTTGPIQVLITIESTGSLTTQSSATWFDYIVSDVPNNGLANLNVTLDPNTINSIPKTIRGFCIFSVEHTSSNSRIVSQAIALRDTTTNIFGNSQTYEGQFESNSQTRLYPFEYLFTKPNSIRYNRVERLHLFNRSVTEDINSIIKESYQTIRANGTRVTNGVTNTDVEVTGVNFNNRTQVNISNGIAYYTTNNNSQVNNTAGDSFYRDTFDWNSLDIPTIDQYNKFLISETGENDRLYAIVDLMNINADLYTDIYNQKLQIISSIYPISASSKATCIGDFYYAHLTLRATTPDKEFQVGTDLTRATNRYVWRWIFTIPVESRFNILGRFSANAVDRSYKLHRGGITTDLTPLITQGYEVDNFIYTPTGRGYDVIYNENGIENIIYFKTIENSFRHITRLIRSNVFTSESMSVNYRYFKAEEYMDAPTNRSYIISLKSDNKNVYIQQRYGLRLASVRDTLSSSDVGSSYLGSSDLFDREPVEIMYSPSGYVGCQSIFDTHINVLGYWVCDAEKGKIFRINENEIVEVSANKTKQWFKRNIIEGSNNPFKQDGRYFVYNEDTNILHFIQNKKDNPFNITNYPIINRWLSFHDYLPLFGFSIRNGVLWIDTDFTANLYEIDKNTYGRFFNAQVYPSIIKVLLNENPLKNKELINVGWKDQVSHRKNRNVEIIDWYNTIDKIAVHNEDQCSGYKTVKFNNIWHSGETGVNKINLWFFNNIIDVVKNPDFLIDPITIDEAQLRKDIKWYNSDRIRSQYIYAILNFDNIEFNKKWELQEITAEWDDDIRNNK